MAQTGAAVPNPPPATHPAARHHHRTLQYVVDGDAFFVEYLSTRVMELELRLARGLEVSSSPPVLPYQAGQTVGLELRLRRPACRATTRRLAHAACHPGARSRCSSVRFGARDA